MSDPSFFQMKGYADKRVKQETEALEKRIQKQEKELKAKDALIEELRARIKELEQRGKQ